LPGGDFPATGFAALLGDVRRTYPFLPEAQARRLVRAYGTRARVILGNAARREDLGEDFGGGLTQAETAYLVAEEFACTPEDILWRRSKLALHVPAGTAERLGAWLAERRQGGTT
jgi:glycerol-3-phosphate dehydrogenase